jgi:uncharacterized membrane protein YfcA
MPTPPPPELITAAAITTLAGFVQGITGFGSGLVAAAALSQMWPVPEVTVILSPPSVLLTSALLWRFRRDTTPRPLLPLIITLPIGVTLGLITLSYLPSATLKGLLAFALIGAVTGDMLGLRPRGDLPPTAGATAGLLAGAMGAAFNTSGPPILIYAALSGWEPSRFRANLSLLFCVVTTLSFTGHIARGAVSWDSLLVSLCLAPGLVLGSQLGARVSERMPKAVFMRAVRALLIFIAARLSWEFFQSLL